MKISCVINCDTRPGYDSNETTFLGMNHGCKSKDFLVEGLMNKKKFLSGLDAEFIVYVDEHQRLPDHFVSELRNHADTLVIKKHDEYYRGMAPFGKFNDINYMQALFLARGDYVMHFDADTAAFTKDVEHVKKLLQLLDSYKYISYPSAWSPNAITTDEFDHAWASTRFFVCKRETLDFTEIEKCLLEPDYMWAKYGEKKRKLSWMEHVLGITANSSVFYPPIEKDKYMIFCWSRYVVGTLQRLDNMPYEKVVSYVKRAGDITYPADVKGI